MFADFQVYLLLVACTVTGFWLLPYTRPRLRAWWLILASATIVYKISPAALLAAFLMTVTVFVSIKALEKKQSGAILWGAILLLIAITQIQKYWSEYSVILSIGLSFVLLKSIIVLVDTFQRQESCREITLRDITLLNLFFPIFAAGPIERPENSVLTKLRSPFSPDQFVYGIGRFAIGVFKVQFLANTLLSGFIASEFSPGTANFPPKSFGEVYAYVVLRFLVIYLNFSGYTDMAVGVGRMLSLPIMENFRFPLIAQNIQEFWQRWHLSLGNFINRYLFIPFARYSNGAINMSIVASFLVVGLWHSVTLPYAIWGLLHGFGLVSVSIYKRFLTARPALNLLRQNWIYRGAATALTISYVAWLSTFANSQDLEHAWAITGGLFSL